MKDDGQQIWSAVFLGTPIALLVVFMITAVPCLSAQTSNHGKHCRNGNGYQRSRRAGDIFHLEKSQPAAAPFPQAPIRKERSPTLD
jgi:hypothetical protein